MTIKVSTNRQKPGVRFVVSLIYFEESSYLEAVEFGFVSDVGEMIHVFKEPVVRFSRGQQSHPAKLMCHSLLQKRNSTGTCDYEIENNNVNSYKDIRPVLQHTFLCFLLLCVTFSFKRNTILMLRNVLFN